MTVRPLPVGADIAVVELPDGDGLLKAPDTSVPIFPVLETTDMLLEKLLTPEAVRMTELRLSEAASPVVENEPALEPVTVVPNKLERPDESTVSLESDGLS